VVAHLLHLIEKHLGGGVHGAVELLLEASEVVVSEIQLGATRIERGADRAQNRDQP
jgi:hypothetical protein